jgi:nitroreductase
MEFDPDFFYLYSNVNFLNYLNLIKTIMNKKHILIVFALMLSFRLFAQSSPDCVTDVILSGISERAYTTVPVTDQQIDVILRCGIKAPSAMNLQPWKFTVVKDEATMKKIIPDVTAGNVLIIISGADSKNGLPAFDCGLATESMFIAAHGLGLGARIYGSPVKSITTGRDSYQIPTGFSPVMVLRIGNVQKNVDAVSSASPRKGFDEVVNFLK